MSFIAQITNVECSPARKRQSLDAPHKVHTISTLAWLVLMNGRLLLSSIRGRKVLPIVSALVLVLLLYRYWSSDCQSITLLGNNCGTKHFQSGGSLSESFAAVMSVMHKIERNNTVIFTMVNPGYDLFLENWDCFAKPLIGRRFLVYTTDYDFGRRISEKDGYQVLVRRSELNGALDYGTIEYQQLMLARTEVAAEFLRAGKSVFIVDNDSVWLSDPLPYVDASDADIVASRDGRTETDDVMCGGFLYLRHTPTTQRVWSEVTKQHRDILDRAMANNVASLPESEQILINDIFQAEMQNISAVREKGLEPLRVHFLDPLRFPNGLVYFTYKRPQEENVEPVVIHNNYIVGYGAKLERFEKFGLWAVAAEDREGLADVSGPHRCTNITRN